MIIICSYIKGTLALGTSISISGTGFSSTLDNRVTIGGVDCSVTAATTTSITCDVGNGPVGEHKVVVNIDSKGVASHSGGDVTFSYTADISSISPTTGSLGGESVFCFFYCFDSSSLSFAFST